MLRILTAIALLLAVTAPGRADTFVLKDGTTVQGTVVGQIGKEYRVKTADGKIVTVREPDIKQRIKASTPTLPSGSKPGSTGTGASDPGKGSNATSGAVPPAGSSSFATVKRQADAVESPIIAVAIWDKFIDSKPSPGDLETAKAELERWQKLQKDQAEKINGKWIGGDERKKLLKKVTELVNEGAKALESNQTVQGIQKLEEALKIYPYSFEANFALGYFYLTKGVVGSTGRGNVQYMDKAIKSLETASRIMPNSAATWSNLSIGYNFRSKYVESVQAAYKAAKIEDSKEIVQNLVNSIAHAPRGMQTANEKLKPIIEDALLLAGRHGIDRKGGNWVYVLPRPPGEGTITPIAGDENGKPGPAWSGSGFFVTADGYIVTNHHVATGDAKAAIKKNITFRVRMDDGTEKNAELIAIDEKADIALMKIKVDAAVPYLRVADDNPKQGGKALVLGYPDIGTGEHVLQISEGQVKSINPGDEHEVWFDLNTTHGNSGGPIVDKNCRVIGILTAGRQVDQAYHILLGVGPRQIKAFLASLNAKVSPVEYVPAGTGEFDGENLTEQARKSTVLIIAIRGVPSSSEPAVEPRANPG